MNILELPNTCHIGSSAIIKPKAFCFIDAIGKTGCREEVCQAVGDRRVFACSGPYAPVAKLCELDSESKSIIIFLFLEAYIVVKHSDHCPVYLDIEILISVLQLKN